MSTHPSRAVSLADPFAAASSCSPARTPAPAACANWRRRLASKDASAEPIISASAAAGLTAETSYFVRVRGLPRVHADGGGVEGKDITVQCIQVDQVDDWLDLQRAAGLSVDTRICAPLHFLAREARRRA